MPRALVRVLFAAAVFFASLALLLLVIGGIAYAVLGAGVGVVEVLILMVVAGYVTRVVLRRTAIV